MNKKHTRSPNPACSRLLPVILILLAVLAACRSDVRPAQQPEPPLLLLISIDGFRADYLELGITPTLDWLQTDGAYARALRPAFPALTFPNHYTLVTGLHPDHHGMIANVMIDQSTDEVFTLSNRKAVENPLWWEDGQPLWNTASAAGLRSATMFWPGSEAPVHGQQPQDWRRFDAKLTAEQRVAGVLEWTARAPDSRPRFITLYFDIVDTLGHRTGPDSPETRAAIRQIDAALAALIDGLRQQGVWANTDLVLVSDHGMAATPADQVVVLDEHAPPGAFRLLNRGPFVGVLPRAGQQEVLAAALSRPIANAQCWPKSELPERFHYGSHPRVPPWLCLADEGWTILDRASLAHRVPSLGAHGFDPALDSMAALFIAHGPRIRPGSRIDELQAVDVYPFLARLLGIDPEPNDGDPAATAALLRPAGR